METNKNRKNGFKEASKYLNTYYGQLAFVEIYPREYFTLNDQKTVSEKYEKKFNKNILIKSLKILKELNKTKIC